MLVESALPSFLVLGTYRSGTTWLHEVLRAHPDLCLPDEKELMFFSHHFDKGQDWYRAFFRNCGSKKLAGEVCPTYFSCDLAPSRIHSVLGYPKLMVTLRRPSEQIVSMYRLWQTRGNTDKSLEEVLDSRPWLIENVLYYRHLLHYEEFFGEGAVMVMRYDELLSDPYAYLRRVFDWLEIPEIFQEASMERFNASRQTRSKLLERVIAAGGTWLRRYGLLSLKSNLNRTGLVYWLKRLNTLKVNPTGETFLPSYEVMNRLAVATANDRRQLGVRLGMDLDNWI